MIGAKIIRRLVVPTGDICVIQFSNGSKAEFLSIGDYGQSVNLNQNKQVVHQKLLPLTEKWVITISSQAGCSVGCSFCDVPKVGPGINFSHLELEEQINLALKLHPEITHGKRLNIHYARMGEPLYNLPNVLATASKLHGFNKGFKQFDVVHQVVSTMVPKTPSTFDNLKAWLHFKNEIAQGDAGLQLSINSTSEYERQVMFNGMAETLTEISKGLEDIEKPLGRKITLNFAVAEYQIDALKLKDLFDPEKFIIKLTPMHKTASCEDMGIKTPGDYTEPYPYEPIADKLRDAGFEVLVFIASKEEDLGRITCGNAILAGVLPSVPYWDTIGNVAQ